MSNRNLDALARVLSRIRSGEIQESADLKALARAVRAIRMGGDAETEFGLDRRGDGRPPDIWDQRTTKETERIFAVVELLRLYDGGHGKTQKGKRMTLTAAREWLTSPYHDERKGEQPLIMGDRQLRDAYEDKHIRKIAQDFLEQEKRERTLDDLKRQEAELRTTGSSRSSRKRLRQLQEDITYLEEQAKLTDEERLKRAQDDFRNGPLTPSK